MHSFQTHDFVWSYKEKSIEKQIEKIIMDFKPDVIHTHFGHESWWFLANLKPQKIPIFISFHGFDASHKIKSRRYLYAFDFFNKKHNLHPIFVSEYMAKSVEEKTGPLSNTNILYYGTDTQIFKRISKDHKRMPFIFLQISSFTEKKGHEYTIKAFCKLLKKKLPYDCKLILAGEGQLKNKMIELAANLGISRNIMFPGLVNTQEARSLMENAHVFVHHSITSAIGDKEGIPNAIMEAMAMELPIISTYHSGIPELVENMVNGILIEEKNINSYENAMLEIMNFDYLPVNRSKVLDKFEKSKHAQKLFGIYQKSI
jgi:glycosyltransferase involved in cell wall biosynthesis